MSTDSDAMKWQTAVWHHPPIRSLPSRLNENDLCICPDGLHAREWAFKGLGGSLVKIIIADHKAAAAARECKHEVATQRFHFYQEGNPAMSWWCSNCGALFLHDEVKLPALDEVTR